MSEEGYEQKYVKEAFDTNWVVPMGPNVNAFEQDLANFANGCSDGTDDVLTYDQKIRKIGKLLTSLRERNRIEIGEKRSWILKK